MGVVDPTKLKTKLACILEADGKFIPMPQAMKIPAAKAAVDKDWENWRKFRRGTSQKSKARNR